MITKKEKIEIAKGLIDKNLGYRKISKKAHLSFGDIAKLKKEAEGISTEEKYTQAYKMFEAEKNNLEVALELGLTDKQTLEFRKGYLTLKRYDRLQQLYESDPQLVESLLNLEKNLSFYGIPHENFLEYIGNLDSREELKTEIANLQNQDAILTTKVIDLHQKFRNLDSDCKAKKDKVDRLSLEEKRLAIKIIELQKAIDAALKGEEVAPLLNLIRNERLIYNFENQMGFIQKLDEALKLTIQFNYPLTWRLATASYSPEDQHRIMEIFMEQAEPATREWLKETTKPSRSNPEFFPADV
jgi:chromosome segregation ATPase